MGGITNALGLTTAAPTIGGPDLNSTSPLASYGKEFAAGVGTASTNVNNALGTASQTGVTNATQQASNSAIFGNNLLGGAARYTNSLTDLSNGFSNTQNNLASNFNNGQVNNANSFGATQSSLANSYGATQGDLASIFSDGTKTNMAGAQDVGGQLQRFISGGASGVFNDPVYQAMEAQGEQGVLRSMAARGKAASGNEMQAISQGNISLANNFYNQQLGNLQSSVGSLANLGNISNNALGIGYNAKSGANTAGYSAASGANVAGFNASNTAATAGYGAMSGANTAGFNANNNALSTGYGADVNAASTSFDVNSNSLSGVTQAYQTAAANQQNSFANQINMVQTAAGQGQAGYQAQLGQVQANTAAANSNNAMANAVIGGLASGVGSALATPAKKVG
jgi:hypothetical protein